MRFTRATYSVVVFGVVMAIYILTLAPAVGLIDSGELALVSSHLGVAHPTGYPLYTLLGRIFVALSGLDAVIATNFMSAFFGAFAAAMLFLLLTEIYNDMWRTRGGAWAMGALLISIAFGFLETVWSISTVTEVYSLELVLVITMLWVLMLYLKNGERRYFFILSYLTALAFSNHMMTVLFIPSMAILITGKWWREKRVHSEFSFWFFALILFTAGLSLYIYLPVRARDLANSFPLINWDNPQSSDAFFRHISGWQYRVWMFQGFFAHFGKHLSRIIGFIYRQSSFILPVFALIGAVVFALKKRWLLLIALLVLAAVDFVYVMGYSIPDIDSYLLPLYLVMIILSSAVLLLIHKKWLFFTLLIIPIAIAALNWHSCDKSNDRFAENITYDILTPALRHSTIILGNWDLYDPAFYIQTERRYRKDITLVDYGLLKRSWYVRGLAEHFTAAKNEIERFVVAVAPFEHRKPYNGIMLQNAYEAMVIALMGNGSYPIYSYGMEAFAAQKYPYNAEGILYRHYPSHNGTKRVIPAMVFANDNIKPIANENSSRRRTLLNWYERMFYKNAGQLYEDSLLEQSAEYMKLLLMLSPQNSAYIENLGVLYVKMGEPDKAMATFKTMEKFVPDPRKMDILYRDLRKKMAEAKMNGKEITNPK